MKLTKKELLKQYNNLIEEEEQAERINAFLERNQLKIGDLKKILQITLGEEENKEIK